MDGSSGWANHSITVPFEDSRGLLPSSIVDGMITEPLGSYQARVVSTQLICVCLLICRAFLTTDCLGLQYRIGAAGLEAPPATSSNLTSNLPLLVNLGFFLTDCL